MVGYVIAVLKKEKSIVGLRIITLEDRTYKDFTMKSAKALYTKSKDLLYNIEDLTMDSLKKLPLLDIDSNKLSKDLWTVMLGAENQYLICNAKGDAYSIAYQEASKFSYTNAVVIGNKLDGEFIKQDTGQQQYDNWLLFGQPIEINNGELNIKNEETSAVLEVPSIVTSIKENCWKNARHFEAVKLSYNIKEISSGDLEGLSADLLILPIGINKLNAFSFGGCKAREVVIQGNTLPAPKVFFNSEVKEVYVPQVLVSKYRTVLEPGMKVNAISAWGNS